MAWSGDTYVACAPLWQQRPSPDLPVNPDDAFEMAPRGFEMVRVGGVDIELRVWDWTHPTLPPWWCLLVPNSKTALPHGLADPYSLWPRPAFLWRVRRAGVFARLDAGLAHVPGVYRVAVWHTGIGFRATVVMIPATDESTAALRRLHDGDHPEPQWERMGERDLDGHLVMEQALSMRPTRRLFPDGNLSAEGEASVREQLGLACPDVDEVFRSVERQRRGGPG